MSGELEVKSWTGRDGVERLCPVVSPFDGKLRTCKRRDCKRCGPGWALAWYRSMSANFAAYGGPVVLVTITAPGADRLPWDDHFCRHVKTRGPRGKRHKVHSGPAGCRVQQRDAREWSDTLTWRWAKLRGAAQAATKRQLKDMNLEPVTATLLNRAYEPQKRGVPHLHLVLGYKTRAERDAAHVFVGHLKRLATDYDFGFADGKGKRKPGIPVGPRVKRHGVELAIKKGEDAARYLSNYLTGRNSRDKSSIRENIADPVMPRSLLWITPRLTSKEEAITLDGRPTHVTMRMLRRARQLMAAAKGLCEAPKWTTVMDAADTALVYRRAYARRSSGNDPPNDTPAQRIMQIARAIDRDMRLAGIWHSQLDQVDNFAFGVAGLERMEAVAA